MADTQTIHFEKNLDLIENGASAGINVTVADPLLLTKPFDH
jgi:hypothetical protein